MMSFISLKALSLRFVFAFLMITASYVSACSADYIIDYKKSRLTFSGTHAGEPFEGIVQEWQATIFFDDNNLDASYLSAEINMLSVQTGYPLFDNTLPKKEWLNSDAFEKAFFKATSFKHIMAHQYTAIGVLTFKGVEHPFTLPFTLNKKEDGQIVAKAGASLNRKQFNLGQNSDPDNEWVSESIDLSLVLYTSQP